MKCNQHFTQNYKLIQTNAGKMFGEDVVIFQNYLTPLK